MRRGGGDFDPDRGAVDAAHAQQVIGDGAVAIEKLDEGSCRACGSTKRAASNGCTSVSAASGGIAEDRFEMRIGGEVVVLVAPRVPM